MERAGLVADGEHFETPLAEPLTRWQELSGCRVEVHKLHAIRDDNACLPFVLETAPAKSGFVSEPGLRLEMFHVILPSSGISNASTAGVLPYLRGFAGRVETAGVRRSLD